MMMNKSMMTFRAAVQYFFVFFRAENTGEKREKEKEKEKKKGMSKLIKSKFSGISS